MILLIFFISIYGLIGQCVKVNLFVPKHVLSGASAILLCQYNLEGDPLYAVKWYRGNHEFYRYIPKATPQKSQFPFAGIKVDLTQSDATQVRLINVPSEISGKVSCEVSVDNTFKTASDSKYLNITDFIVRKPYLSVSSNYFNPNRNIQILCLAQEIDPPALINFYVDYVKVERQFVTNYGNGTASLDKEALVQFLNYSTGDYVSPIWVSCQSLVKGFNPLSSASVPVIPQFPVPDISSTASFRGPSSYDLLFIVIFAVTKCI